MDKVWAVYSVVTRQPGHPHQFLYIDSWLLIAQNPPLGSRYVTLKKEKALFCWCRQNTGKKSWEKIYHDAEEEELPLSPPYWGTRWGVPEQEEEIRKEGDFPLSPPLVKEALFPPIVPPSMMGVTAPALYTPSLVQKKEKSESHYSEVAECTKKPQEKVVLQMPLKDITQLQRRKSQEVRPSPY